MIPPPRRRGAEKTKGNWSRGWGGCCCASGMSAEGAEGTRMRRKSWEAAEILSRLTIGRRIIPPPRRRGAEKTKGNWSRGWGGYRCASGMSAEGAEGTRMRRKSWAAAKIRSTTTTASSFTSPVRIKSGFFRPLRRFRNRSLRRRWPPGWVRSARATCWTAR